MPSENKILGVRVDSVTQNELATRVQGFLHQDSPGYIVTVNGEIILQAQRDEDFCFVINAADLVVPDSTNVMWVSVLKGHKLATKIPGSDLMPWLCGLAAQNGWSIYLLGAREGVAAQAAMNLQKKYPGLIVAGTSAADPQDSYIPKNIKQSRADIVFVAYGAPTQEKWIAANQAKAGAKLYIGVGGTFDMIAGVLPRAPKFLRALRLEWFWRIILQPSRLKRAWNAVIVFPLKALFS